MKVDVKAVEDMHVAYVRHVGPYPECKKAWDELTAWAFPKGLFQESTRVLGVCYDDPEQTPPEKIRYDACITVPKDVQGEGNIKTMTIKGGDYAVLVHEGSYENLSQSWKHLFMEWLPASGRECDSDESAKRMCFEQYLNDPTQTKPEDLRTAIHIPIR